MDAIDFSSSAVFAVDPGDLLTQFGRLTGFHLEKESLLVIAPELTVRIRHLFFVEHWKIGTMAAELGIHWKTVGSVI